MTKNNNYKKAILTTFLILPLFTSAIAIGSIPNANAGVFTLDLNPPDYRGDDDSVFASWVGGIPCFDLNGDTEPDGPLLPGNGFPVGLPTGFNAIPISGPLFQVLPDLLPLDPGIFGVTIPNIVDTHTTKNVRVQIVSCSFDSPVEGIVLAASAEDNNLAVPVIPEGLPGIFVQQIGPESFLIHATYDFIIEPNPDVESFVLSFQRTFPVAVIVDTVSFSEPEPEEPRTIGFWKNHQEQTEEHLPMFIGGYEVVTFDDATDVFNVNAKNAHDMLAAQLLAAEINVWNNVTSCQEVDDAIEAAHGTLGVANYEGPGSTDAPKKSDKGEVNAIKDILNQFNNFGCS